jgi:galactose mutarotase-like enzyme
MQTFGRLTDGTPIEVITLVLAGGYDHCFALNAAANEAAELRSERSGVTLRMQSDQSGLQFYGGQGL